MQVPTRSLTLLAASLLAAPAAAQTPAQSPATAGDAHAIIQRIEARNPSLQTFQSRVHVDVRMLNFPFLSPKLDGTSYYKRPNYAVVFDRMPSYARGIGKVFDNIGNPAGWERDSNVVYEGVKTVDGRPLMMLSMTKKIHSDQLKAAVAYVDPATYEVVRMDWQYYNGGSIVMSQTFRTEDGYSVIASQHAEIHIPHVRAVADASYAKYAANVAVNDDVFTKK